MDDWFNKNEGALLLALEQGELNQMLSKHFGDCLVQIGGPCNDLYAQASPITNRIIIGQKSCSVHGVPYVVSDFVELPLLPDSVDVIVCMHVIEYAKNPEALLDELYQALAPNGQLIVIGFNPMSLWGLAKLRHKEAAFPWDGKFYRQSQVRAMLIEAGYSTVRHKTVCFRPPMKSAHAWRNLLFLEPLGQLLFSGFGGVYFICAKKEIEGMTVIPTKVWEPAVSM